MSYWSWQRVACPVCNQPAGEKCRTLKTGRVTDTHIPRIDKAHEAARVIDRPERNEP